MNSLLLAIAFSWAPMVHASPGVSPGTISATPSPDGITYSFSGVSLAGFELTQLAGSVFGTLTGVSINATLDSSGNFTYADDLMFVVAPLSLASPLLQVGGFSDSGALERHGWANGDDSTPGTTVIDTVALDTLISFAGNASDPALWLGNGWAFGDTSTWTGSISLAGLHEVAAVPEPSTWVLLLAGIGGLAALRLRRPRLSAGIDRVMSHA